MTVVSREMCIYISQYILLKFLSSILYWFVYDDNESCTSSIHSTWKFVDEGLKLTSNNRSTVHCELHVVCFNSLMSTVLLMIEGGFFFGGGRKRGLQLGSGRVNNCFSLQISFRLWRLICFGQISLREMVVLTERDILRFSSQCPLNIVCLFCLTMFVIEMYVVMWCANVLYLRVETFIPPVWYFGRKKNLPPLKLSSSHLTFSCCCLSIIMLPIKELDNPPPPHQKNSVS
jgi:hypothetical protein